MLTDKLEKAENRFEELEQRLTEPEIINDRARYAEVLAEHTDLSEIVETYRKYKDILKDRDEAKQILTEGMGDGSAIDPDFRELLKAELSEKNELVEELERKLTILLTPKDPNDDKNVIVEIRGGAGGEEAALFAYELYRMYTHYADEHGYKTELIDINETEIGGIKEVVFNVNGRGAYSRLKYESGVHRVQRVPETETQGRVHTSTATVAVLPEVTEAPVNLDMKDVDIDIYRSSGAGGQHINKTDSAIRLTHRPTGIVVTCQDQRSQLKNKEKAFQVLYAKLAEISRQEFENSISSERHSQIGTGDRSERIRTYNYTQNRVTDHRIDLTLYRLPEILNGDLDEIIDALITTATAEKLAHQ